MKIYLLEVYTPDIKFDEGSLVIALTPLVCYQLDKAGIKYSVIEDYYDEVELAAREDDYHQSQLRWISGLDAFIQENIKEAKELDLKLGSIYYFYLKTAVLDPVYLRCYTLRKLFAAVKPSAVSFVSPPPRAVPLDYTMFNSGRSYYSEVLEALCKQNNIALDHIFLEASAKKDTGTARLYESLPTRFKGKLAKSSLVRGIYFLQKKFRFSCKYLINYLFARQAGQTQLNILLLKLSHIGEAFIIEALKKGHRIYQLSGNTVIRYSCFGTKKYGNLNTEKGTINIRRSGIWESTANLLEGNDLIKQFNTICQSDVSGIVMHRLKYFISEVCPEILGYIKVLARFYEENRIDFVITPHEVLPTEFAAIAAGHCQSTKSVNLQHGDSAYNANFWDIMWLAHFDIDISSNVETREYFRQRCQMNHFVTRLYQSPHRLLPAKQIGSIREKNKSVEKDRIIYLPTMFIGERSRFDSAHYPDTWYYKFQKALIEYLSTRKEYTFVWKGLPTSDAVYNPIPDFIKDNNYVNIEIATNPFIKHLPTADRVICDYPSTGFYESVVAGISTISLYHRALKVRKSALEYFGKLLAPFTDISEAIAHIDAFLGSDPELYKTTIDMEGRSVLKILEEISQEKAD